MGAPSALLPFCFLNAPSRFHASYITLPAIGQTMPSPESPESLLIRKTGGVSKADHLLEEMSSELGLVGFPGSVLAAIALLRMGVDASTLSRALSWQEFEDFTAALLGANGYTVSVNIVITKPRRQIDIFARSSTLALCVDCKHWTRSSNAGALEKLADEQTERSVLYKKKMGLKLPVVPLLVTLGEPATRRAGGVPVVPVWALRSFLNEVNPFDQDLRVV